MIVDSETEEVAEMLRKSGIIPERAIIEEAEKFAAEGVHTPKTEEVAADMPDGLI